MRTGSPRNSNYPTLPLAAVRAQQQVSHAVVIATATRPRCPCRRLANDSKVPTLRLRTSALAEQAHEYQRIRGIGSGL
jgi:hypothetical protein